VSRGRVGLGAGLCDLDRRARCAVFSSDGPEGVFAATDPGPGRVLPMPPKQGPCSHCGATSTPLWRKGPPDRPVLCNACGTRWKVKGTLEGYVPGQPVQRGGKPAVRPKTGPRYVKYVFVEDYVPPEEKEEEVTGRRERKKPRWMVEMEDDKGLQNAIMEESKRKAGRRTTDDWPSEGREGRTHHSSRSAEGPPESSDHPGSSAGHAHVPPGFRPPPLSGREAVAARWDFLSREASYPDLGVAVSHMGGSNHGGAAGPLHVLAHGASQNASAPLPHHPAPLVGRHAEAVLARADPAYGHAPAAQRLSDGAAGAEGTEGAVRTGLAGPPPRVPSAVGERGGTALRLRPEALSQSYQDFFKAFGAEDVDAVREMLQQAEAGGEVSAMLRGSMLAEASSRDGAGATRGDVPAAWGHAAWGHAGRMGSHNSLTQFFSSPSLAPHGAPVGQANVWGSAHASPVLMTDDGYQGYGGAYGVGGPPAGANGAGPAAPFGPPLPWSGSREQLNRVPSHPSMFAYASIPRLGSTTSLLGGLHVRQRLQWVAHRTSHRQGCGLVAVTGALAASLPHMLLLLTMPRSPRLAFAKCVFSVVA